MKYAVLIILLAANAAIFRWLWLKTEIMIPENIKKIIYQAIMLIVAALLGITGYDVGSSYFVDQDASESLNGVPYGIRIDTPEDIITDGVFIVYQVGYFVDVQSQTDDGAGVPSVPFTYKDFRVDHLTISSGVQITDSLIVANLCDKSDCSVKWVRRIKSYKE